MPEDLGANQGFGFNQSAFENPDRGQESLRSKVKRGRRAVERYVNTHVVEPEVNNRGTITSTNVDLGENQGFGFNQSAFENPDRDQENLVDKIDRARESVRHYVDEHIVEPEVRETFKEKPGAGERINYNPAWPTKLEENSGHQDWRRLGLLESRIIPLRLSPETIDNIDRRVERSNEEDKPLAFVRILTSEAIEHADKVPSTRAVARYAKIYKVGRKYGEKPGLFNALGTFNACEALAQVCGKSYEPPTPDREEMSTRELMSRISADVRVLAWEVSGAVLNDYVIARDTAQESGGKLDEKFNTNSVSYSEIRRWGSLVRAKWRELDTALAMSGYEAEQGEVNKYIRNRSPYIEEIGRMDNWVDYINRKEDAAMEILETKNRLSLKKRFEKMMKKAAQSSRPNGLQKVWMQQWEEEERVKREKKNFGIAVENDDPLEADNCRRLADRSKAKISYLNQKQEDILFDDEWKIPFHWLKWKLGRGARRVFENSRLVNEFVEDNAARVGDRIKQSLDLINEENRVRRIESEMISAMRSLQAQFSENNRTLQAVAEELWSKDDDELEDAQEELIAQGLHVPQSTVKLAEAKYGELLNRLIGKGKERRLPVGEVQSV